MIKAVFFDMNETLLDTNLLKRKFRKYFEDEMVFKYWFTKLLHYSTVMGSMGEYADFAQLSKVSLETVFLESGLKLTKEASNEILGTFKDLEPYKDVKEALSILRKNKIKVIPVSNSSFLMMKEQLTNANILELVDVYYSVDDVAVYKPFAPVYLHVAKKEELKTSEIVMVATHDWDLFGAKKVGLTTAYIKRKETVYNPYYLKADLSSDNLIELVNKIICLNDKAKIKE